MSESHWSFPFTRSFSDRWLVTRKGMNWFLACVIAAALTTPIAFGILRPSAIVEPWGFLIGLLAVPGAVCTLFLWFGMWAFWTRLDNSSRRARNISFFVLFFGVWFGAILYFFYSYRPQVNRITRRVEAS